MGSQSDWYCWEIMQCENPDDCPAKLSPQKPCWEIARESGNDRHALNICWDCIVRMIKEGSSLLSNEEIMKIIKTRAGKSLGDKDLCRPIQPFNVLDQFFG